MVSKTTIYNLVGTFFDKGLPIIISAFLTKFMTASDYALWSLFFTFLLLSNSLITTPVLTIFSRKFHKNDISRQKMNLYYYKQILLFQALFLIIYYSFFSKLSHNIILEIPAIFALNLYSYQGLFLRFKEKVTLYMFLSLIRLVVFATILVLVFLYNGSISYTYLIFAFLFSHLPTLKNAFDNLRIPQKDEVDEFSDFIYLSLYGISTSLVNGIDKFVIVILGYSLNFLGYYSFIYSLAIAPSIFIEAFKKTIVPLMYKDWSDGSALRKVTKTTIYKAILFIFLTQLISPIIIYFALIKLNLINPEFILSNTVSHILILSTGFFFHSLYHFLNPYYFYNKLSKWLLLIQFTCTLLYLFILKFIPLYASNEILMLLKSSLLIFMTLFTFFGLIKLTRNHVKPISV